ncbi:hypothetical protein F4778DRAFT_350209 [Xylariomycetidae sp. FL2044]|nr:hypothetical protein F4778DRAFT_350209 [Xylariomycetidae sp. FL2044]
MAKSTVPTPTVNPNSTTKLHITKTDRAILKQTFRDDGAPHAVLTHVNADTTWLLSLPYPADAARPSGRSRYNILIDPWLQGPQSDVASWFSTQWHVVAPSVGTIGELDALLAELEEGGEEEHNNDDDGNKAQQQQGEQTRNEAPPARPSHIDVVAISHEFTDHCHEATLRELPRSTPVFATDKAAELIRSWRHFDTVITTPAFSGAAADAKKGWQEALSERPLPPWVGIGRVVTAGNALYYHSAIMLVFQPPTSKLSPTATEEEEEEEEGGASANANAVIYSPHGIKGSDLAPVSGAGIRTLALLHGLHDVRIWMTKQLNLGAVNGLEAVRATGARFWVATHDEVKKGGGFIAPLLRRTRYTVADAVRSETRRAGEKAPDYEFVELGSGDVLVLD